MSQFVKYRKIDNNNLTLSVNSRDSLNFELSTPCSPPSLIKMYKAFRNLFKIGINPGLFMCIFVLSSKMLMNVEFSENQTRFIRVVEKVHADLIQVPTVQAYVPLIYKKLFIPNKAITILCYIFNGQLLASSFQ